MTVADLIWFQGIKIVLPLIWKILPKESQKDILQELWAWQEVLKFRNQNYSQRIEMGNLVYKLLKK